MNASQPRRRLTVAADDARAPEFDSLDFRDALGTFTTGVTIVTACDAQGAPVGVTATSFNAVSRDPPWVLWSLSRASGSFDAFRDAGHWAVHILAHDQEELASRFGRRRHDKFDALPVERGVAGIPLLAGCVTRMQCRSRHQYDGGDHVIMVGEVLGYDHCERVPLVYQRGAFAIASRKEPG